MASTLRRPLVRAEVRIENGSLEVCITDASPDTRGVFADLDLEAQAELAVEAWSIGLGALRNALAAAEGARLGEMGKRLMEDVGAQLKSYGDKQNAVFGEVLKGYFDPESGQISQRLHDFVRDEGTLAKLLKQNLNPENSVLARTLAENVGEASPIFRLLSPTESEGMVKQLEARIKEVLDASKNSLAEALNPRIAESPVAFFLGDLKKELKASENDREEQLKKLTKELDANDDDSLLSKLVRKTDASQRELRDAINPEREDSPMAHIKKTLVRTIDEHAKAQKEFLETTREDQMKFEKRVSDAITRIETRKDESKRTTHGGFEFEDAVVDFVAKAVGSGPFAVTATGADVGALKNSKKGDQVVRFTAESAFAGAGVVVEAKRDRHYNIEKALAELDEARKNRNCQTGLFVMAKSHAPAGFPRFARYGSDVLVTWDEEDPATDAFLQGALLTALALSPRVQGVASESEIGAVADIEKRLGDELSRLEKMKNFTENIVRDAGKIETELERARKALGVLIKNAGKTLSALNIEVRDNEAERASPITLDDASLQRGVDALRPDAADSDEEVDVDEEMTRVDVTGGVGRMPVAARRDESLTLAFEDDADKPDSGSDDDGS